MNKTRIDDELYEVKDARRDVVIDRSMADVWKGKRGNAAQCMNARCVIRHAGDFPHKVIAVSVQRSRVLIIDRPPTEARAGRCVRYVLSQRDSNAIDAFDAEGVGGPATLVLRAPKGRARLGEAHTREYGGHSTVTPRPRHLVRGEKARLLAAAGVEIGT